MAEKFKAEVETRPFEYSRASSRAMGIQMAMMNQPGARPDRMPPYGEETTNGGSNGAASNGAATNHGGVSNGNGVTSGSDSEGAKTAVVGPTIASLSGGRTPKLTHFSEEEKQWVDNFFETTFIPFLRKVEDDPNLGMSAETDPTDYLPADWLRLFCSFGGKYNTVMRFRVGETKPERIAQKLLSI